MTMLNGLRIIDTLPLAALEVGKHWYWEIGNLKLHGQVFICLLYTSPSPRDQ